MRLMVVKTSKVSQKGLTTIPSKIREKFNIKPGMHLIWEEIEGGIHVRIIKDIPKFLKGKFTDLNLKYNELEDVSDELLSKEVR